ncbi:16S rRNA processing protein RimM [Thermosyntropha lipolytica DSM 11003]|uniref:Ribosome maturation factor RimM n=1 Tax=Thermosyntropha lipolytica DSM 11003 TaxID=1123382 RepID=A0A1M5QM01_9FIRM|nr:ribosome maturation factor RimM [Thermosyntropha lipolytica]SHH15164.1 16S rRNA processing protein RimM [Thermosyntropha lipolytica DSM 11003]
MNYDEMVAIGKIVGTFGFKGTVKIALLTDFPERFKGLKKVRLYGERINRDFEIEEAKAYNNMYLIKFKGIESKEEAIRYKNVLLMIHESEVYPLPEGYYYHFQLKGLKVYDEERGFLGELTEILETGANDVYIVNSEEYGEILLPAIKSVIKEIKLEENIMKVKLLPGIID